MASYSSVRREAALEAITATVVYLEKEQNVNLDDGELEKLLENVSSKFYPKRIPSRENFKQSSREVIQYRTTPS